MNRVRETNEIIRNIRPAHAELNFKKYEFSVEKHRYFVIYESGLREAVPMIERTLRKCARLLAPKSNILFIVVRTDDEFIKKDMMGSTGFAWDDHIMFVQICKDAPKWKESLIGTIAHEFNHAMRYNFFRILTLRDSMAFEGLAQCFETEMTGEVSPWSRALTGNRAKNAWIKIKPYLDNSSDETYNRIFLSRNDKKFPHWSGYSVSYIIVKRQLSKLKLDWNTVMKIDSRELIGEGL